MQANISTEAAIFYKMGVNVPLVFKEDIHNCTYIISLKISQIFENVTKLV